MRSMTGCGRGHDENGVWDVTVDIRSVNHRFLDISCRLGTDLMFLQDTVRKEAGEYLKRGHLDVSVTVKHVAEDEQQVTVNEKVARLYYDAAKEIAQLNGCELGITAGQLLAMEGVCTVEEVSFDRDAIAELTRHAMDLALEELVGMSRAEGDRLQADLAYHLKEAETIRDAIEVRAPGVVVEYREKLLARLDSMNVDLVDDARLAQEVALIADKCAIDEELSRLSSHFHQMHLYLEADGEIGKKMDFLIQEMNREANTIGSKASDAQIAQYVVNLKSEIEKLREQIQNVE